MSSEQTQLAVISEQIKNIIKDAEDFITRMEFDPVKKLVYGLTGMILVAVITAILSLVIKK